MTKFKIVRASEGKGMMATEHESCIYDDATICSMMKCGYKAYLDGHVYKPSEGVKKHGKGRADRKAVR